MLAHEFCLDNFRDIKKALVMQHIVNIFLAILDQLFCFEFLRLFVFTMQFLEFQSHAANINLIKAFRDWFFFIGYPKNGKTKIKCRFHKWKLDAYVIREKMKSLALLSLNLLVNSANNKKFGYSQLGAYFFYFSFSAKILIKHLQLYLLYSGCNYFENGIERASKLNRTV